MRESLEKIVEQNGEIIELLSTINKQSEEQLIAQETVASRWLFLRIIYGFSVLLFLTAIYLFGSRFYEKNQILIKSTPPVETASLVWDSINSKADLLYPSLEDAFNEHIIEEWRTVGTMQDSNGNTVTLNPISGDYRFNDHRDISKLPAHIIYKLHLNKKQAYNANQIIRFSKEAGATQYETNVLLSVAWAETNIKSINEYKKTRFKSKAKCGDWGKGVFQFTCTATKKKYNVSDPWDLYQSTRGALQFIRFNRRIWTSKGVKDGTPYITKLMIAGFNAGTYGAAKGLRSYKYTRHHSRKALSFYRLLTTQ